jgi:hypothetical protein
MNKKVLLALFGGCLLLCCCAISVGSAIYFLNKSQPLPKPDDVLPTTKPTVMTTLSATPSLKPTASPIIVPSLTGGFLETFDDNRNDWELGEYSEEYMYSYSSIENGKMIYETEALQEDGGFIYDTYYNHPMTNFEASIDTQLITGQEDTSYGLIFNRIDNQNFYFFIINTQYQQFKLKKYVQDEGEDLVEWSDSSAIKTFGVNNVRVKKVGAQITMYINNQQVATATDSSFSDPGDVGFLVVHYNQGDTATVEFDNLRIAPK